MFDPMPDFPEREFARGAPRGVNWPPIGRHAPRPAPGLRWAPNREGPCRSVCEADRTRGIGNRRGVVQTGQDCLYLLTVPGKGIAATWDGDEALTCGV